MLLNNDTAPEPDTLDEPARSGIREEEWLAFLVVCALAFFFVIAFGLQGKTLESAARLGEAVGGVGTFIFSLLGSLAALWWFHRRDPLRPRITIEQEVFVLPQLDDQYVVQVIAHLENVGEVIVRVDRCFIWAYPLDPLPEPVQAQIRRSRVLPDSEIDWEKEHCCGGELSISEVRIRPGETQDITVNILLPMTLKLVKIKTFIPHRYLNLSRTEVRTWTKFTIVKLRPPANDLTMKDALVTLTEIQRS